MGRRNIERLSSKTRLLHRWGVGFDAVDIEAAGEKGITVSILMVGEKTYGPFFMDMAVRNLDAQAISDLNKRLRDMSEIKCFMKYM